MPVTLAEASLNVQDDLQMGVIDEFRKSNFLLDSLTFDDVVSPVGGGATLTYSYARLKTQPSAMFREVNTEYTPHEVDKEIFHAFLKIFGGSFQIDRIIANMGGIVSEVDLQMKQKIKAAQSLFNDTVINGDSAVNAKSFDGLEKALAGSSTEYMPDTAIDLSSSDAIDANYKYFLDDMDLFLGLLHGKATCLLMNSQMRARIRACARRAGMYTESKDAFGRNVEQYDGIPLVDVGAKPGSSDPIISNHPTEKTSNLYAVCLGLDGFHGISMAGQPPVRTWLPDYSTSGAVKTGEVEMVAAVALKATKAAGVFRKIKVV